MVVYFSGTGNSRYCARRLAEYLEDEAVDSFSLLRSRKPAALNSEKSWVFVSPTYAWRLPRIFEQFIRTGRFSGSRDVWFVMTCGGDIGAAAAYIQTLCREKGFVFHGVLQVVMPENYVAMFNVPQEAEARRIVSAALPVLEEGAGYIRAGKDFPSRQAGMADKLKSGPVNPLFYRLLVGDRKFRVTDACVACGKCAELCPLGNIQLKSGKPAWNGDCTHCMACICGCPAQAIEYGKNSVGKPRYHCPEDERRGNTSAADSAEER